jgi:hypothetical protein
MTFNIGKPSDGVTDSQRIQRLYLYLNQMADKLNYALNNMDEQNLTRTFLASLTNGGDGDQRSTKGLKTEQVDEMIRDGRSSALLFSGGTAKAGDTITLNDSVDNYRFLLIRFSNSWMHALCPILDGDRNCTAVRGSHTNIGATDSFTVWSVDGDYAGNTVTIDSCYSANVKSGSVKITARTISYIWGIR